MLFNNVDNTYGDSDEEYNNNDEEYGNNYWEYLFINNNDEKSNNNDEKSNNNSDAYILPIASELYNMKCKKQKDNNCITKLIDSGDIHINVLCKEVHENKIKTGRQDCNQIINNLFLLSQPTAKRDSAGNTKLHHDWKIQLNGQNFSCCRHCVEWTYGLGHNAFDQASALYKSGGLSSSLSQTFTLSLNSNHELNDVEKKLFQENIPKEYLVPSTKKRAALTESGSDVLLVSQTDNRYFEFSGWFRKLAKSCKL